MLSIASSLAGHDVLRVLIPMIPYAFWYATPENDWADLFHRYIPDWMAVKERSFLTEYYRGETTFYQLETVQGWLTTTLVWGGLLCAMVFLMVCINSLVRKQWTEHEKLSYPIIQLPLELTSDDRTHQNREPEYIHRPTAGDSEPSGVKGPPKKPHSHYHQETGDKKTDTHCDGCWYIRCSR